MGKENEPTSLADLAARGARNALVDEKAKVIAFCHKCGVLYEAEERNFVTKVVAEQTAWYHGNFFSLPHHVSVISGESPKSLEETLAVNENTKSKPKSPRERFFIIPIE